MKKKTEITFITVLAVTLPLLAVFSGCGGFTAPVETEKPALTTETVIENAPEMMSEPANSEEPDAL